MREFNGKTVFVTGGASGIGFALGHAFAEAGAQVMLADIEADTLAKAVNRLQKSGLMVRGIACDVSDTVSVGRAAQATYEALGNVHIVCNNAGVATNGVVDNSSLESWRWVLDVNLMGVLHGILTFLPHMRTHGEGGHFVNTASTAGLQSNMGFSPYAASKYAVVSMSEGLAKQLAPEGIGVTLLCPSFTRTRIGDSGRNRQDRYGAASVADPASPAGAWAAQLAARLESGRDPSEIAAKTLAAILANELYVFTHPEMSWEIEERFAAIQSAMDKAASR